MKQLGVFLLPLDRMLVHRRSFPRNLLGFPNNLLVPIYTPGWREALWELSVLPKNTTQCPRPGLKPGPLAPGTSTLTMRPPRLPPRSNNARSNPTLNSQVLIFRICEIKVSQTKPNKLSQLIQHQCTCYPLGQYIKRYCLTDWSIRNILWKQRRSANSLQVHTSLESAEGWWLLECHQCKYRFDCSDIVPRDD